MFNPDTYHALQRRVKPDESLIRNVLQPPARRPVFRRVLALSLVLALCLCVGIPALAGDSPVIYRLMSAVSPDFAQHFAPVQRSCESSGIRLEVVSIFLHDQTAEIYLTLQDLEGQRVDETTDLYDSYSIHRPFSSSAICRRVDYDPNTHTATFLITIDEWGRRDITGRKMTFSFDRFLSHKLEQTGVVLPLDTGALPADAPTRTVEPRGSSWSDERYADTAPLALVPAATPLYTPLDGFALTGAGYADGMLHVQMQIDGVMQYDNHLSCYLVDGSGNKVFPDYSLSFYDGGYDSPDRVDYTEFFFELPQSDLDAYTLYGDFYSSGLLTEGNWSVTFPLQPDN